MIMRRAIASTLQVFALFAFFSIGFCFAALPYLPIARMRIVDLLLNEYEIFSYLGAAFFLGSLLLLLGFYGLNRGKYLRIKMGGNIADVKEKVIRQTLQECFKTHFPKKIALEDIDFSDGGKLEIGVRVKEMDTDEREALFSSAEKELQTLLKERFGYSGLFHLTARTK